MKRFLALMLALTLVLSLNITAFAADGNAHVIKINNASEAEHTYDAYQVFAGDYDKDSDKLSNIVWGSGVDGDAILAELTKNDPYKDCKTAEDVANVLANKDLTEADRQALAQAFADVVGKNLKTVAGTSESTKETTGYSYAIPVTGDGYYFIKDSADPEYPDDADFSDTLTDYILQVVGDVEVKAKSGTVTVDKQVATGGYNCGDENHKHTEACYEYADSNTAEVGDIVSYKVESAVPAEAKAFDYYYFILGDKLSDGLTFDASSVKVTIDGKTAVAGTDYTVKEDYNGYTFAVALVDAKANAGKTVVVTYEATVNDKAVIGAGGNSNEVTIDFSRDPNENYGGKTNPPEGGFPADGEKTPDGKTPKDITKTYVTEIKLLKVDGKDNTKTLEGATFAVSGTTESAVVHSKDVYTESASGTLYKLVDGSYTEDAPVDEHMEAQTDRTAGGYVVCEASDPAVKYTIGGTSYREATTAEMDDTSVALFKHIASNEYLYESTTQKYEKTTDTDVKLTPEEFSFTGTTDKDGNLVVTGLNAGEYTITELVAPEGYNLLKEPIKVTVACELPEKVTDGTEKCEWSYKGSDNKEIGKVLDDGTVQITIENNEGTVLPETGGMGTTIFYVLGSIMLVGAAILLVTKKRMEAQY